MATEMYSLPPIYNLNAKVDLPTCMYSLPVIQSSAGDNIQTVESSSPSSAGAGYMDALEKRQDSILARLGQLKDQVSAYKQSIGLGPIPDVKPATNAKGSGCIADIVVKASPSRPPHSLPTALAVLQSNGYAVFMSTHTHSSVTTGANKLKAFLPPTVTGLSRSLADVRVTFIWAEVSGECELIVSPLTQSVIKGEVNILRYLARVFDDEFVYENSNNVASLDCMLDTIASLPYAVPKNRPPMLRTVTSSLPKVFNGDDITVADLALFSYLKQGDQGGNLPQEVKKWMEGMTKWSEEMMSSDEGKKRSPRRRNYRRSHRTSHNHKEGPPEKKHRESEKEKSPKKEKSPQKSIKEEKGLFKEKKKKKSPVIFDRDSDNSVGSFFTKQWPEVPHIFQSSNLNQYVTEAKSGFVAEKLDGSNLGISSRGVVASRRTVLLNKPTDKQLLKYKFSGVTLKSLVGIFEKLSKVEALFKDLFPFLDVEVIVYGELVQKGTATCKGDKFGYSKRGYEAGKVHAFGLGVVFEDDLSDEQINKAVVHLVKKGFHAVVEQSDEGFKHVVVFMNEGLKEVLENAGIAIIHHDVLTIEEIIASYEDKLLHNELEGVVVNFGSEIFKWKGLEESYPDMYLSQIESLFELIDNKTVVESFKKIALKSRSLRVKSKSCDFVSSRLEKAYTSALSKLRPLAELLEETDHAEVSREGIIEEFKERLKGEMSRDALESIEFKQRLEHFIKEKTKSYTR